MVCRQTLAVCGLNDVPGRNLGGSQETPVPTLYAVLLYTHTCLPNFAFATSSARHRSQEAAARYCMFHGGVSLSFGVAGMI